MGVSMQVTLKGLSCSITHEPSGAVITTVPPADNGGDGTSFSPTDLMGAALASCLLTTLRLVAQREGLHFEGIASARVVKEMVGPPRRVGSLALEVTMPSGTRPEERPRLEQIAKTCPVALSLSPELSVEAHFVYP